MNKEILRKAKEEKGITLIALVITIIVLLILAGITLSMVLGPNGIIDRAKQAKEQTQAAALNEQLMFNQVDNYLEEQLGGQGKELKLLVDSGDDGSVVLPINPEMCDVEDGYTIEWGDGTTGKQEQTSQKEIQLASNSPLESINLAASSLPQGLPHLYNEPNKKYVVTISGKCETLNRNDYNDNGRIVEILSWGETGLKTIGLSNNKLLEKIASPSKNSFANVTSFNGSFAKCSSLTSIPSDLFANCPNVTEFDGTFQYCRELRSIPENLFANCPNVTSFIGTFEGCNLTSIPENLFANCPNVISFEATFSNCGEIGFSIPAGLFANCSKVESFRSTFNQTQITSIPADLFANCPEVLNFYGAFALCSSLTSIPANLFANNQKVKYDPDNGIYGFTETFATCTSLTGDPIRLWEEGRAGITETTGGEGCYANCTGLNGYVQIPEHWKQTTN